MSQKKLDTAAYYFVGPTYPFSAKQINILLNYDSDVIELIQKVIDQAKLICISTTSGLKVDDHDWLGAIWFQTEKEIVLVTFPHCNDEKRKDGTATDRSVAFYTCIWQQGSTERVFYEQEVDIVVSEIFRIIGK